MENGVYHPLEKVVAVVKTESGARLRALTCTGSEVDLEVVGFSARTIRLRMIPPGMDRIDLPSLVVGPGPASGGFTVEDGPDRFKLRAEGIGVMIHKHPWRLWFTDGREAPLCGENPEDLDVWNRKKVKPLGYWALGAGPAQAVCESFALAPDEGFFGFGEKYTVLNKRGQRLEMWAENAKTIGSELAYKNVPFFMSTKGYGIFVNSTGRVVFEMGSRSTSSYTIIVPDPVLDLFVIAGPGPSFKDMIAEYTALTGRPPLPPRWSFGLWMSRASYASQKEVESICSELRRYKVPCDVVNIDPAWMREGTWCCFEWDRDAFPEPAEMIKKLREMGFRVCLWEMPYVPKGTSMFDEGERNGFFVKRNDGKTYTLVKAAAFDHKPLAVVDFTNPRAVEWYKTKHKPLLEMGVAAFKTDFGEAAPEDGIFANGLTGREMHNLYPLLYNKAVYEAVTENGARDGVVWGRSGCAGSQRYPVSWGGDPATTFTDLATSIRGCLSYGLSGGAFWACDIGGFYGPKPSPELYIRWAQFGLLCSHSRCHGTTPREPWEFGERVQAIFNEFTRLRYRLLPYIYHFARIAAQTGLPVVRPLLLEYPDDPNTYHQDLEYLLGTEILVAPIYDESGSRPVYLPEGEWLDFWTLDAHQGRRHIVVTQPLERVPIFIRQNSIIPLAPDADRADCPWEPLTLDIYVSETAALDLERDDGSLLGITAKRSADGFHCAFSTIIPEISIVFNRAAPVSEGTKVAADGAALPFLSRDCFRESRTEGWSYDAGRGAILVRVKGKSGVEVKI